MSVQVSAEDGRGRALPFVAGFLGLATVLAVVLLALYLNRDTLPPRPATFQLPAPTVPYSLYNVKESGQDELVLSGPPGSADIRIQRPSTVEVMVPSAVGELQVGDWVNVIGIVDEVRNFSIRTMVSIPQHGPVGADGAARSTAGFTGLEVRGDPAERVVQGGQIVSIAGLKVTLAGPSGEMVITLTPNASIFRLAPGDPAAIASGDRLVSAAPLAEGSKPAVVLAGKLTLPAR